MNRRIFWLTAAVPAAIAGHALSYAFAGRIQNDAHHAYLGPALQYSGLLFSGLCIVLLWRALGAREPRAAVWRTSELWMRLCVVQIMFYVAVESLEGFAVSALALVAQVAVALLVAAGLSGFSRVLTRCERSAIEAGRYAQRRLAPAFVLFDDRTPAYALRIAAGNARFGRAPPLR